MKLAIWAFEETGYGQTRVTYLLQMDFGGTLGGNKSVESMIRYLVGMAKLPDYLSRNGKITSKINHYFDINWGSSLTPNIHNHVQLR